MFPIIFCLIIVFCLLNFQHFQHHGSTKQLRHLLAGYTHTHIDIYIYVYIYRERDREDKAVILINFYIVLLLCMSPIETPLIFCLDVVVSVYLITKRSVLRENSP